MEEVTIDNFQEILKNAPQYIILKGFKIQQPYSYSFLGCVKICQDGDLALRLFCPLEAEKVPVVTSWEVSILDNSKQTNPTCLTKEFPIEQGTSPDVESEWNENNSVHIPSILYRGEDGQLVVSDIDIKWSVKAEPPADENNHVKITCCISVAATGVYTENNNHPETSICETSDDEFVTVVSPNSASVHDPEECYKMDARPRGICIVLVNYEFYQPVEDPDAVRLKNIGGYQKDRDALQATFTKLDFVVKIYENQTDTEMLQVLEEASKMDHTQYDCFVCCILSHGGTGHVYGANGRKKNISYLTSLYSAQNCRSLIEKPKLFFIQACRGSTKQPGVSKLVSTQEKFQCLVLEEPEYVPNEADYLLGYATLHNYVALCDRDEGGWYIQKLTEVLDQLVERQCDIHTILTCVNSAVSKIYCVQTDKENAQEFKVYMQVPAPQHTLTKKLIFR